MSQRSFTVFQDAPAPAPQKQQRVSVLTRAVSRALSENVLNVPAEVAPIDKENVNPATGERASGLQNSVKKRKTVLAAKLQPPPATKGKKLERTHDREPTVDPEHKKRRPTTSSLKKTNTAVSAKGSVPKKVPKRASSRPVQSLPQVEEEDEKTSQATIDARCYDLTVKPLADVSEAFEEPSIFDLAPLDEKAKFATVKAASVEPEIRDYIEDPQILFSTTTYRPQTFSDAPAGHTFSTPERKKIYTAFTFSSPVAPSTCSDAPSRSQSVTPSEDSTDPF